MKVEDQDTEIKSDAETQTVEDLVDFVRRGLVRLPVFQRALRWNAVDVVSLFDSVHKGYPIGSLLLRKGPAPAARLHIGPLTVDAPETDAALWVIDGQQRLTALTAGLVRPSGTRFEAGDPYVVFFDPKVQKFEGLPSSGQVPTWWVPVSELLDSARLSEWVYQWQHGQDRRLRTVVFQAGTRIRQYKVPLYIVTTQDEDVLRDVFYRINNFGKSLSWQEVHDALFGNTGERPGTLKELASELASVGIGTPDEDVLLPSLLASKGLDVTRSIADHYRKDPNFLHNAVTDALPALRATFSFLKLKCEIPHLRLLPKTVPIVVLTRFFGIHSVPNARTTELLTRWVWRLLLSGPLSDERTLRRRAVSAVIPGDEEGSVQQLLGLVHSVPSDSFELPNAFDARSAENRLALLGISSFAPELLDGSGPVGLSELIETQDINAFRKIFPDDDDLCRTAANRVFLPGNGSARKELLDAIAGHGKAFRALATHAVDERVASAILAGDVAAALNARKDLIENRVAVLGKRLAGWARTDRPSIRYLLEAMETES